MPHALEIHRPINRVIWFIVLFLIAVATANRTSAQALSACSWPFEVTGQGFTNIATPDTNATYWVMPLDTNQWPTMIIDGQYPAARFFNFVSYGAIGAVIDSIIDADIAPDRGSTNPFAVRTAPEPHNYRISVARTKFGSSNFLQSGDRGLVFIVYRVYVPDRGLDRNGGVPLPALTLIAADGTTLSLQPCPFAAADSSAASMVTSLRASGFSDAGDFVQRHVGAWPRIGSTAANPCTGAQPTGAAVTFSVRSSSGGFFPNPATTYVVIFRNTIPYNFSLTGDYFPQGVFCKRQTFVHKGARACFAAAGINSP